MLERAGRILVNSGITNIEQTWSHCVELTLHATGIKTMTELSENHESVPYFAQHNLHEFNNQVFRISILTESLGQKVRADREPDESINSLIQRIQSAVFDAAESGKNLANLIENQSKPAQARSQS